MNCRIPASHRPSNPVAMFQPGLKYRIVYQIPGTHRVARQMVAAFVMAGRIGTESSNYTEVAFSGRPEFGTTMLRAEWIKTSVEVPSTTKCFADRKVRKIS